MNIKNINSLLKIIPKIGVQNVLYVIWYRFSIYARIRVLFFPKGKSNTPDLFFRETQKRENYPSGWKEDLISEANKIMQGNVKYFAYHWKNVGDPPDWFYNPFNNKRVVYHKKHWIDINDFNSGIGDIKIIWELSRFSWLLVLTRAYLVTGDKKYLDFINLWLEDWIINNPLNTGPNWKCGQETAVRIFHILTATYLLEQHKEPSESLTRFVFEHCERIYPNIRFAIAQDNNHGISEAAALYIAGNWFLKLNLLKKKSSVKKAKLWRDKGQYWIENRLDYLIMEDGTFSQYSMIYHRVLIDILSFLLLWKNILSIGPFPKDINHKIKKALSWINGFTDIKTGNVPNIGANDGSMIIALHSCNYRNFKPSNQLLSVLLNSKRFYEYGDWDEPLWWLRLDPKERIHSIKKNSNKYFAQGGFVKLVGKNSWGVIRFPKYLFRPKQCDALHFDLWHNGVNLLRDAGTYSYNLSKSLDQYFPSVGAHNTIQIDGHNQMARIGRFMYGDWISAYNIKNKSFGMYSKSWEGEYQDTWGSKHYRRVKVEGDDWKIIDEIKDFSQSGILRWRCIPAPWKLKNNCFENKYFKLTINSNCDVNISITDGWESLYYYQKSEIPVLEISFGTDVSEIITEIRLK